MSRTILKQAQNLIKHKQYDKAAAMLESISDDPIAQKWLEKLREENLVLPTSQSISVNEQEEVEKLFTYSPPTVNQTQWEYRNVSIGFKLGIFSGKNVDNFIQEDVENVMNKYGEDGWELVTVYWNHAHAAITAAVMTFKRPKSSR